MRLGQAERELYKKIGRRGERRMCHVNESVAQVVCDETSSAAAADPRKFASKALCTVEI